jgi:hypothetical protein
MRGAEEQEKRRTKEGYKNGKNKRKIKRKQTKPIQTNQRTNDAKVKATHVENKTVWHGVSKGVVRRLAAHGF